MRHLVLLGAVLGAHGIRGEVKLRSFTADPAAIANYGPLRTKDGRRLEIAKLKPARDGFIAAFKGITDRDQAEALRGLELYVPRAALPAQAQDEVYVHDLIGLPVVAADGTELGQVIGVENYGAGDLLDVRVVDRKDTVLIPFSEPYVTEADSKRIVVELPAGYLDET